MVQGAALLGRSEKGNGDTLIDEAAARPLPEISNPSFKSKEFLL
jgi:hypothetical protein